MRPGQLAGTPAACAAWIGKIPWSTGNWLHLAAYRTECRHGIGPPGTLQMTRHSLAVHLYAPPWLSLFRRNYCATPVTPSLTQSFTLSLSLSISQGLGTGTFLYPLTRVCMYVSVCMYVCMHVCMYARMHAVCMYGCTDVRTI